MGHTKDLQIAWYRKHDSTIELSKVARALVRVDVGIRKDLQNKRIEDLDLGGQKWSAKRNHSTDEDEDEDEDCESEMESNETLNMGNRLSVFPKRLIRTPMYCITNIPNALDSLTRHASSDMCGYVEGISSDDVGKKRSWTSSD